MDKPLAFKMKPNSLNDVLGQEHLIGKDKILTNLVKNKKVFSMILYGDPGIGKTSIAYAMLNDLKCNFRFLNATINKKQDFDVVFEEAKMYDGLVLVVDEIHRLNKDKQDLLLPCIESGLITLIGLTTSNPYHKINPAIRSRCQIFKLNPLTCENILKGLKKASKSEYLKGIKVDNDTLLYIAKLSNSDLRYAYNLLEMCYYSSTDHKVSIDLVKSIDSKKVFLHDKDEQGHFDTLSGLQKSIRGSDVHASLHYLARLIVAGDLESIFRRLSVIVYEDIGLANPSLGPKLDSVINACERIGLPEAQIPLSSIVIEMALSPKSNTACLAIDKAISDINSKNIGEIPPYLKSPYTGYLYPHNYKGSITKQVYLPTGLVNEKYYIPKPTSKYEIALKDIYEKIERFRNN